MNQARYGSASLRQVAALLDQDEVEVLTSATSAAGEDAAVRGWLKPEAVSALVAGVEPRRRLCEAQPLIVEAFRQAGESSKSDWTSMTVPVLKNRLLHLTSQGFNEADYGSPNIWHFVTLFPSLLATEGDRPNERIRLLNPEELQTTSSKTPTSVNSRGRGRLRADLWRAVFDYQAKMTFVWDEALGLARPAGDGEALGLPVIPTLSADEMKTLRASFVKAQERLSPHNHERLNRWATIGGTTAALPKTYRPLWNDHLKSHATSVLLSFFADEGLNAPTDLIEPVDAAPSEDNHVERARHLAHRYIDAMTGEELSRLSIELAVAARVHASL